MYSKELEELIDAALADGVLTEKEKQILFKKAKAQGIDLDEFEMILDARLLKAQQAQYAHTEKEKKGNIITCPYCGAHVSALAGVCPECGHEFTNVGIVSSAQKLTDKLDEISKMVDKDKEIFSWHKEEEKRRRMASCINTFAIPNAKADLFEFAVTMKSKMHEEIGGENSDSREAGAQLITAYLTKYKECMLKIQSLFATDPMFTQMMSTYKQDVKEAKNIIIRQRGTRSKAINILFYILTIVAIIGLHIWFYVDIDFEWWQSILWGAFTLLCGGVIIFVKLNYDVLKD